MGVESIGDGESIIITGQRDIDLLRIHTMIVGLKLEIKGFGVNRGRTCYSLIKDEYGFKGNRKKVLMQAMRLREQMEARRADTPENERIIVPETPPVEKDDVDQRHL